MTSSMLTPPPSPSGRRLGLGSDPIPPVLAAALGLGLAIQLLLPPSPLPIAPPLHPVRLAAPVAAAPATPSAYPAILARPLFSPTRSGVALAGPAAPAGAFALLGVALDGRRAIASFRDTSGGVVTVRKGESLQGWRLDAVGRDRAVLRLGAVTQTLQVGVTPAPGAAGLAPAQGPGGG